MRFYSMRRRGVFILGVGAIKQYDILERYYFYYRVLVVVGPYEFGIEKKCYINKEDK